MIEAPRRRPTDGMRVPPAPEPPARKGGQQKAKAGRLFEPLTFGSGNDIPPEIRQHLLDLSATPALGCRARVLLVVIAHAIREVQPVASRDDHATFVSTVSGVVISNHTGLILNNVYRAISELVEEGSLVRRSVGGGTGDRFGRASTYVIAR